MTCLAYLFIINILPLAFPGAHHGGQLGAPIDRVVWGTELPPTYREHLETGNPVRLDTQPFAADVRQLRQPKLR